MLISLALVAQSDAQVARSTGRSLLNIGSPATGAFQFINFMKTCHSLRSEKYAFPEILSGDGYPKSTPTTMVTCQIIIPLAYEGNWVISWKGQFGTHTPGVWLTGAFGPFTVYRGGNFVTDSTNGIKLIGIDGYVLFKPQRKARAFTVQFLTTGTIANITDIAIYRADQEANYMSGAIFDPDYLSMLRQLNPKIIRFLAWNNINGSNRSRQAYDTPVNAMTYVADQWVPSAWGGSIRSRSEGGYAGAAAPDTPATYTQGETYQGFIADANTTTTPTLDVGGRGSKPIKDLYLRAPAINAIAANSLNTFVYDAKLDVWMWRPGGLQASVPLAMQVALCNAAGMDGWFQIPHLFDGNDTEAFARTVRDKLNKNGTAYFEYSNEVWNFGYGFAQTYWAQARSKLIGFPGGNVDDYYALQDRILMARITNIWPPNDDRLRRVTTDLVVVYQPYLTANRLAGVHLTLDANGNYTTNRADIVTDYSRAPNRPIDYIDILSYADYFRGSNIPYADAAYIVLEPAKTISRISNGNPGVLTIKGHGYSNGDRVKLSADLIGMEQLRNAFATVKNATSDTFEIADVVDVRGQSMSPDTSSYAPYVSGGSTSRVVRGAIDAALSAADRYASRDPALMQQALNWMQNDVYRGLRKNGAGVPTLNGGTLEGFHSTIFPAWQATAAAFGKKIILYEGAYDGVSISPATATKLGIDPAYSNKIADLIDAYKKNELISEAIVDLQSDFASFPNSQYPAWSLDISAIDNKPLPWALFPGDLYSKHYESFDGVAKFNEKR